MVAARHSPTSSAAPQLGSLASARTGRNPPGLVLGWLPWALERRARTAQVFSRGTVAPPRAHLWCRLKHDCLFAHGSHTFPRAGIPSGRTFPSSSITTTALSSSRAPARDALASAALAVPQQLATPAASCGGSTGGERRAWPALQPGGALVRRPVRRAWPALLTGLRPTLVRRE